MLGRGKRANLASLYRICVDGERGQPDTYMGVGGGEVGMGWGGGGQVLFVLVQES